MTRVLLFLFAVMQAQVIVSLALVPSTICPERCQDDGPDGRCPPACLSCASSAHPAPPLPARSSPCRTCIAKPCRSSRAHFRPNQNPPTSSTSRSVSSRSLKLG